MIILLIQLLLSFFLAFFSSVFFHEVGHWICGIYSGYKIYQLKIFGFTMIKNGKVTFKQSKELPANQCLMLPPQYDKFAFVLLNLGGVLANLILVILSTMLLLSSTPGKVSGALFILVLLFNFYSLIMNGIPLVISGLPNDVKNIFLVRSSPSAKKAFHSGFMVDYYLKQGKKLEEIEDQYFTLPEAFDFTNIYVGYNQMQWAIKRIESGDTERGLAILERLITHLQAYRKYTYYYTIIASTIIYYFNLYEKHASTVNQLAADTKLIQYGSQENIPEFQVASLMLKAKHTSDWQDEYTKCKQAVEECQTAGLTYLYLAQLRRLSG